MASLRLSSSRRDLERAAELIRAGELVAFPTETVYGLGADARNGEAVAGIYAAKGRPRFNPLIVHVDSAASAQDLVQWNATAARLAAAFWPGPLTMVLPVRPGHGIASLVMAGLETLAIRVPAHPVARTLLAEVGGPVAAPSANPSGRISPTSAAHVLEALDGRIAAVVDAGPCNVGVESTIVGLQDRPVLLRPGGVAREDIEAALDEPLTERDAGARVTAPGQLTSHYAPRASVSLDQTEAGPGGVMLGFGKIAGDLNLSPSGDLGEAAANLFDYLHRLDARGAAISVAAIPETGLGAAINDRLRRAAAERQA